MGGRDFSRFKLFSRVVAVARCMSTAETSCQSNKMSQICA
jgi:hypothetical protein